MTKQDRIAHLSKAGDWRAALMILTSERFRDEPRVWKHVDLERGCIYFEKMLEDGTFSGGEHRMLKLAASLFSQEFEINMWMTFNFLDEDFTELAIRAICSFCGVTR